MGLEIPAQLQWLAPIVVGQHWPSGDETALRRLGEGWTATGTKLGLLRETAGGAAGRLGSQGGGSADGSATVGAVQNRAHDVAGAVQAMEDRCSALAAQCDNTAANIEYTKYLIIGCLVLLAIQLTAAVVSAVATAGASLAEAAVAEVATRATVATLFRGLVARIAELGAAGLGRGLLAKIGMNVLVTEGMDAGIQGVQFAEGTRTSWDVGKTVRSIELGVAGGVVGAVGELIPTGATEALADTVLGSVVDQLGRGAIRGGVEGAATVAATGNVDPNNLLMVLSAGMVGGAMGINREQPFGDIPDAPGDIRALLNRSSDGPEPAGPEPAGPEPAAAPADPGSGGAPEAATPADRAPETDQAGSAPGPIPDGADAGTGGATGPDLAGRTAITGGDAAHHPNESPASAPGNGPAESGAPTAKAAFDQGMDELLLRSSERTPTELAGDVEALLNARLKSLDQPPISVHPQEPTARTSIGGFSKDLAKVVGMNVPSFVANFSWASHLEQGSPMQLGALVFINGVGGALNGAVLSGWRNYYTISLSVGTGVTLSVVGWGAPDAVKAFKALMNSLEKGLHGNSSAPTPG